MTPEETQAALLADWLQSPPGTAAPEGLDEDVLAAVYALRPDRAPPLMLTMESILQGVESGPLAAKSVADAPAGAAPSGRIDRVRGAQEGKPQRRASRSRAWWAVPGVGAVLTAAAAGLLAIKLGDGGLTPSPELAKFSAAPASQPMAVAPAPEADEQATSGAEAARPTAAPLGKSAPDANLPAGAAADPIIAEAAPSEPAAPLDAPLELSEARARDAAPAAPPPAPTTASTVTAAPAPISTPTGSAGASANAAAPAPEPRPVQSTAPSKAASRQTSESVGLADDVSADVDQREGEEDALGRREDKAKKDESERSQRAYGGAPTSAAASPQAQGPTSAASPSTAFDYNPSFYTSYPELAEGYAAARASESAGRYSDALAAYAAFRVSPHPDVAQDAAWRAARCLRSLGRLDDALTTVQSGLRQSSANTAYRSNLYSLQGELYSALGRAADAEKAWAEAARLNSAR